MSQVNAVNSHLLPREQHVLVLVEQLLSRQPDMFGDWTVDVAFDALLQWHSKINLDAEMRKVSLKFQALYLAQDTNTFCTEVVPHAVAHVYDAVDCTRKGRKFTPNHKDGWQYWVGFLAPNIELRAAPISEFDARAVTLVLGGSCGTCDCPSDNFHAVKKGKVAQAAKSALPCDRCRSPIEVSAELAPPPDVARAMSFIKRHQLQGESS